MVNLEWPYPGLKYLVHAGYQIATGRVLRDITSTVITQGMTDLLRNPINMRSGSKTKCS